jgi:UDP-2-acetamido-3-amino-2,3-dideoxy-glucuronate N-acetyltransferase
MPFGLNCLKKTCVKYARRTSRHIAAIVSARHIKEERNMDENIHKTAIVEPSAEIGSGTKIWHWTHVDENAVIGKNCMLGQNVYIGKDVIIGNNCRIQNNVSIFTGAAIDHDVFIGPSVVFTNAKKPRVGRKAHTEKIYVNHDVTIGAGSVILPGITVGFGGFVGAGSVVTKNVASHSMVMGHPAEFRYWVCSCGERLNFEFICKKCGRVFKSCRNTNLVFKGLRCSG